MKRIKPIILLGAARNGTTMLCNLATEHTEISSVQHKLHWGLNESNIYKNIKFWGTFNTLDKYLYFLELYCSMDTFQITGLSKEDFCREDFPKDFLDFYFEMMDEFAIQQGAKYWLTKIDPLYLINDKEMTIFLDRLNERYGEVKFISIERNINDVIPSYLKMDGKQKNMRESFFGKFFAFMLGIIRQHLYYKKINETTGKYDGLELQFEKVVSDQEKYRKKIFDFLELTNESNININQFQQNSSFNSDKDKKKSNFMNIQIKLFYFIVKYTPILPKFLLISFQKIKPKGFPDYWRLKKEKYFLNTFKKELEKEKEFKLLKVLNL